jgi:hypothetical protein
MTANNGGPAFPLPLSDALRWNDSEYHGMTLRDYFAAAALQGMCAGLQRGDDPDAVPEFAYMMADAMLEARK